MLVWGEGFDHTSRLGRRSALFEAVTCEICGRRVPSGLAVGLPRFPTQDSDATFGYICHDCLEIDSKDARAPTDEPHPAPIKGMTSNEQAPPASVPRGRPKIVVICSGCMGGFDQDRITVVPRYNETMEMVVTAHICPDCLDRVLDETDQYLATAAQDTPWQEDGGLKHNRVIEDFVGFLLNHKLLDLVIEVRYAPSVEEGIARMRAFLQRIRDGERPIVLPSIE
jgi:hypothetical protein